MQRFFGMMPSDEIEKEVRYRDKKGYDVLIQAGPHGWSIIWADNSSTYNDVDADTETNFQTAYNAAVKRVGNLEEDKRPEACNVKVSTNKERISKEE